MPGKYAGKGYDEGIGGREIPDRDPEVIRTESRERVTAANRKAVLP